jgi:hypothetical protein
MDNFAETDALLKGQGIPNVFNSSPDDVKHLERSILLSKVNFGLMLFGGVTGCRKSDFRSLNYSGRTSRG